MPKRGTVHPIKGVYRIAISPLHDLLSECAEEEGMTPGTLFNELIREELSVPRVASAYEPSMEALTFFLSTNPLIKDNSIRMTLYLTEDQKSVLDSLSAGTGRKKNQIVTSLLVDGMKGRGLL